MSVNSELISIMKELGLECEQSEYTGKADKYAVFDYEDERPALIAGRKPALNISVSR